MVEHTFITLTKRWENLIEMLFKLEMLGERRRINVPADPAFTSALLYINANKEKFQGARHISFHADTDIAKHVEHRRPLTPFTETAAVPWLPRNVIFGFSVCTLDEAKRFAPIVNKLRTDWPDMKIAVSQEPALDVIPWSELGIAENAIDWLIWGGESGQGARMASAESWFQVQKWRDVSVHTKIFFKQTILRCCKNDKANANSAMLCGKMFVRV